MLKPSRELGDHREVLTQKEVVFASERIARITLFLTGEMEIVLLHPEAILLNGKKVEVEV